jgi:hypothetical protein
VLPTSAFGKNRALPDGLSFYCLACNRARNNRWYRESRRQLGKQVKDLSWVPDGYRWCPTCRQAVAVENYVRSSRTSSGYGSRCKRCHNAANKRHYFQRRYGLDEAGVTDLRARQGGLCALCGDPDPRHIDHDHDTDMVRALLCERCNLALGLFRDDPGLMRAAADYVELHRHRHVKISGATAED